MATYSWNGPNRQPDGYVDKYSGAKVSITEEHWVIHQGLAFAAAHKFTGVVNGASVDFYLRPNAGNYPHIHLFDLGVGRGDVDFLIYANPTVSADGTELTCQNMNRNSQNVAALDIFHTPTVTGVGTLVDRMWLPPTTTGQGQSVGGMLASPIGNELVLKPTETYLFRFTNNSGATINISGRFMFYELTNMD